MTAVSRKDAVIFELVCSLWERSREFIKQVPESSQRYLIPALNESGLWRDPVSVHVKKADHFRAASAFAHGKDQAHGVGERKLAERLAHEIMAGIRGEKPVFIWHFFNDGIHFFLYIFCTGAHDKSVPP